MQIIDLQFAWGTRRGYPLKPKRRNSPPRATGTRRTPIHTESEMAEHFRSRALRRELDDVRVLAAAKQMAQAAANGGRWQPLTIQRLTNAFQMSVRCVKVGSSSEPSRQVRIDHALPPVLEQSHAISGHVERHPGLDPVTELQLIDGTNVLSRELATARTLVRDVDRQFWPLAIL